LRLRHAENSGEISSSTALVRPDSEKIPAPENAHGRSQYVLTETIAATVYLRGRYRYV